ncbi:hypothetical protein BGZ95_005783 [Linnemannia exigua]|uniref:Uncharacterized protein n=1 Tax=Linnemannia exigua TaxID=604196 RepID=A0AAD4D1L4_9FUNG|nr:hypothetical protein BGZ95_005783 [Linnemannia exigua]
MLSPDMTTSASASSFNSPIQSATSPRLMPTKSRPTTALVFGQQDESLPPHLLPPPLQDNESLSSDEFVLSASSGSSVPAVAAESDSHSKTSSTRSGLKTTPNSTNQDDQSSESGDDADGRLTDTESELVRGRTRTGTPVIAGRSNNHHRTAENGPTSALQSLREIEEHDLEGRQTQLQGLESRFRTTTLAQDQDLTSEGGDSTTESDTQPKSAMDPVQIQGKSTQTCYEAPVMPKRCME